MSTNEAQYKSEYKESIHNRAFVSNEQFFYWTISQLTVRIVTNTGTNSCTDALVKLRHHCTIF